MTLSIGADGRRETPTMEIHTQTARTDPARARRIINHMQLFGHPGLAQPLIEACAQLPVRRAGQGERNRRARAERRYPRTRASFQVGDKRCASLLGATKERVGRREESV